MTRVAVLGLGTMGNRIAGAIASVGHEVIGWDPEPRARRAAGVQVTEDADVAVAGTHLVVLSVPGPAQVLAAVNGPLQRAADAVVADLSTIDPATAREAARILADRDTHYVDAPVLGRPEKVGAWTLPVGGEIAACDAAREILEGTVAARVLRVGDVGAGSTVKLLNNLMFGAINAVTAEVLNASALAGVDPEVFVSTVADSGAATVSNLFRELAPKMVADDYDPAFALALLAKDNRLVLELAQQVGAHAPIAELVDRLDREAMDLGMGAADTGAVQELYRAQSSGSP